MSTHQRTNIRNALQALIKGTSPTYNTAAGANVFTSRLQNLATTNLPAIRITFEDETATARDLRASVYNRTIPVKIEAIVQATANLDDTADSICYDVEALLGANRSITGTASSSLYTGTNIEFNGEGEKPIAIFTLNYEITYLT